MRVISDTNIPLVVKSTALRCFVTVTQVMIQFPPHQVSTNKIFTMLINSIYYTIISGTLSKL